MKHHFQPSLYHNTFGPHAPVLRVADGDTISTSTIDAHGFDARGECVADRPNPQTGPFYVEGAEPGDALAVRLDRIAPSREYGWTATVLAPNVVEPETVREMPDRLQARWRIDRQSRTATLVEPDTALGRVSLPLAPMLGCIGTAPRLGQVISTMTSAEHGGNMDYNGLVEGATIYLPVFVEGGLLFIGDGHAVQGAGEMVGTGIEVSMDVELTVRLLKGKAANWPRGENERYIFTMGNARPLDQAVQHATSEMVRWLAQDYGLDARAAHILLGMGAEYDLGNMFDPAYTMVCKLPRRLLPGGSVQR